MSVTGTNKVIGLFLKVRDNYQIKNSQVGIKKWELLMLLVGGYLQEIINCIIATFFSGKIKNLTDIVNKYPFNQDLFWTLILKVLVALILFKYFLFRLRKSDSLNMWYVSIFLIYSALLKTLISISVNEWISLFFRYLIPTLLIIFFFFKDKSNIDAFKYLFYEQQYLYKNQKNEKFYKYGKFSKRKIIQAFFIVITTTALMWITAPALEKMLIIFKKIWSAIKHYLLTGTKSGDNLFVLIFMAPIIEELVFRKCIMDLGKNKLWVTIASGFFFGLIHLKPSESLWSGLHYIIPGIMLSTIKYWTRNIWFSIFSHGLWNLCVEIF